MVIPLSMGVSTLLNGTLGFAMMLALLFCMPSDINSVLSSDTYYPFMNIYAYAVGSNAGATAMVSNVNRTFFDVIPSIKDILRPKPPNQNISHIAFGSSQ